MLRNLAFFSLPACVVGFLLGGWVEPIVDGFLESKVGITLTVEKKYTDDKGFLNGKIYRVLTTDGTYPIAQSLFEMVEEGEKYCLERYASHRPDRILDLGAGACK